MTAWSTYYALPGRRTEAVGRQVEVMFALAKAARTSKPIGCRDALATTVWSMSRYPRN